MVMVVIVARMVSVGRLSGCELLSGSGLRLRVEIFDLGLTKDAVVYVSSCLSWSCGSSTHIQVLLVGER